MQSLASVEESLGRNAFRREPAISGAFPAHLGAELAMFMIVPLAFRGAFGADAGA